MIFRCMDIYILYIHCMYEHVLFIHSIDGHLRCFPLLAILSNAATDDECARKISSLCTETHGEPFILFLIALFFFFMSMDGFHNQKKTIRIYPIWGDVGIKVKKKETEREKRVRPRAVAAGMEWSGLI